MKDKNRDIKNRIPEFDYNAMIQNMGDSHLKEQPSWYNKHIWYPLYRLWVFYLKPTTMFYSLKNGIKNFIKWFPVIWRDRDWDYQFLQNILIKKFESMYNYYGDLSHPGKFVGQHYTQKQIGAALQCLYLMEKAEKESQYDYYTKYSKLFSKIYVRYHRGWWD